MNLQQNLWDRHVVLVVLTALFWAGNAVAGRIAIDDVSPFLLSFLRWFILLILLWTLYWKDIKKAWPHLKGRWLYLILMGGLGLAGFNLVFYKAAHYTTAVNIGILQGSIPLIVLLAAYLVYHSRITIVQLVGVLLGLAGVIMVASGGVETELRDLFKNRSLFDLFDGGIYGGPMTKDEILSSLINKKHIKFPALFIGDSKYDYEVASRAKLDFLFVSGWSEFKDWRNYCNSNKILSINSLCNLL